jgi:hypothetical protein
MPDANRAREALDYNPETGTLIWRERPSSHFKSADRQITWNKRFAGKPAGSLKNGYIMVVLNYERCFAHRLAWLLTIGQPVPDVIDHIDHDPLNNRIANLRAASQGDNGANSTRRKDNNTGIKGVGLWNGKYRVRIRYNKQEYWVGYFKTLAEATMARRDAAERLHGKFARHE